MSREQFRTSLGIAAAIGVVLAALSLPPGQAVTVQGADTAGRLAFAARWMIVPMLCLLVGVAAVAARRFFSPAAIDGGEPPEDRLLQILRRYNLNTLEQAVLAGAAWVGLALVLPAAGLGRIPMLAGLFGLGRALFLAGYLIAPWARAVGFGITFYPTAGALIWLGWRAVAG